MEHKSTEKFSIVHYGIIVILVTMLVMIQLGADSILLLCITLTLFIQILLYYMGTDVLVVDIMMRFVIDMLVVFRLKPKGDLTLLFALVRATGVALELSMLFSRNIVIIIIYVLLSIVSFVLLGYILYVTNLISAIIFRMPIYLVGYLGYGNAAATITTTNIINKALYIFAVNELLKDIPV